MKTTYSYNVKCQIQVQLVPLANTKKPWSFNHFIGALLNEWFTKETEKLKSIKDLAKEIKLKKAPMGEMRKVLSLSPIRPKIFLGFRGLKGAPQQKLSPQTFAGWILEHLKDELWPLGERDQFSILLKGKVTNIQGMDCFSGNTQLGNAWAIFLSKLNIWCFCKNEKYSELNVFFRVFGASTCYVGRIHFPKRFG